MWADNALKTDKIETIENFVAYRSASMYKYIQQNNTSSFIMWYKSLMHSDLTTRGKRTDSKDGFERNLLYYLSVQEMEELQKQFPNKQFESAKQSNIGLPDLFYSDLEIPRIKRRKGQQVEKHKWISLNDYFPVYLVNDTTQYFTKEYTEKILFKLNKQIPPRWDFSNILIDRKKEFTEIELHQAVHGLGIEKDTFFHSLRLTFFLNDTLIFIIEKKENEKKLFLLLEKNPFFFYLAGMKDETWVSVERLRRFHERERIKYGLEVDVPEQLYKNDWDNVLLP